MPRPEHCARPVSRIHSFKERWGAAAGTECHVGANLSRAQMGTIVHPAPDKLPALRDRLRRPAIRCGIPVVHVLRVAHGNSFYPMSSGADQLPCRGRPPASPKGGIMAQGTCRLTQHVRSLGSGLRLRNASIVCRILQNAIPPFLCFWQRQT